MEAVLLASENHWVLGWLAEINGRLEVVGLEVTPPLFDRSERGTPPRGAAKYASELVERLAEHAERWRDRDCVPLRASVLRGLPLSRVLSAREEVVARSKLTQEWQWGVVTAAGDTASGLRKGEQELIPHLMDAVMYASAISQGDRAPARRIAEARTISLRTAQGRVAKARALGLLAPATPGTSGGGLTEYATDFANRVTAIADILGSGSQEANNDG